MKNQTYSCSNCGCDEFVTNPFRYDIFKSKNGKIIFEKSETVDEKVNLFCRDCSEKIHFNEDDIVL